MSLSDCQENSTTNLKVTVMLIPAKGKQKETRIKNLSSILNQATASS
jgi:hypothetical protein